MGCYFYPVEKLSHCRCISKLTFLIGLDPLQREQGAPKPPLSHWKVFLHYIECLHNVSSCELHETDKQVSGEQGKSDWIISSRCNGTDLRCLLQEASSIATVGSSTISPAGTATPLPLTFGAIAVTAQNGCDGKGEEPIIQVLWHPAILLHRSTPSYTTAGNRIAVKRQHWESPHILLFASLHLCECEME